MRIPLQCLTENIKYKIARNFPENINISTTIISPSAQYHYQLRRNVYSIIYNT